MKQQMPSLTGLVLLAHGSRDKRWRAPFESLAQRLAEELDPLVVRLAYLELCGPTLAEIVAEWPDEQGAYLRILPLFLSHGAHVRRDIQRQVEALRSQAGHVELELLAPAGDDARLFALFRDMAREAAQMPL